jgi:hypothetical protein
VVTLPDASSNPYVTGAIAIITAPVVITAIQSAAKKWYDQRHVAGSQEINFTAATIPQQLTIPAPFRNRSKLPPKWDDQGYQRKYWRGLRIIFMFLTVFYAAAGILGIALFVRSSPIVLAFAVPALLYSAFTFREFQRIGRRAWEEEPANRRAELVVNGIHSDVIAGALSAVSGIRGRLLKVDVQTGEITVIVDRKTRLEIVIKTLDSTLVRVVASTEAVNPAAVQSRSSAYRQLYAFVEAFLAERDKDSSQPVTTNVVRYRRRRGYRRGPAPTTQLERR